MKRTPIGIWHYDALEGNPVGICCPVCDQAVLRSLYYKITGQEQNQLRPAGWCACLGVGWAFDGNQWNRIDPKGGELCR